MAVAFFSIPFIVRHAGVDRFALLSFAWMLLGYFSLFDLGLGKATTKQVAESFSRGDLDKTKATIVVATVLNLGFGMLFALAVYLVVPSLVRWTNVPELLQGEATHMYSYLSMSLPLLTVGGTLRCVLEGIHRFDHVNALKAPFNSLLFLIPVVGFALSLGLADVVLWIVITRGALAVSYLAFVLRTFRHF
ncbi:MAG: membrane protein involved in the export of O-antigen and teichoic acid, partial [Bacteroidetes bacterium]|nr:membrane protein involved in the export of O-antigen and teichoic acid [Bacteroidota bacterium]